MWRSYWLFIIASIVALPLLASALFATWIRKRSDISIEDATKCWDVFVKFISALTIVVAGAFAFGKYMDQQARETAARRVEFMRQVAQLDNEKLQRTRALFDEAKRIVADLAATSPPRQESLLRFEELYFGALIGVEEHEGRVERAMVRFRRRLKGLAGAPLDNLESLSLELSRACEEELRRSEDALRSQNTEIEKVLSEGGL